jgi:hypothetical protein
MRVEERLVAVVVLRQALALELGIVKLMGLGEVKRLYRRARKRYWIHQRVEVAKGSVMQVTIIKRLSGWIKGRGGRRRRR